MELRFQAGGPESWSADAVIVFLSEDEKLEKAYPELLDAAPWMSIAPGMRDFHGKKGEMGLLYGPPAHPLSRAVVVGLGKLDALTYAETLEEIRKGAGAAAVRAANLAWTRSPSPFPVWPASTPMSSAPLKKSSAPPCSACGATRRSSPKSPKTPIRAGWPSCSATPTCGLPPPCRPARRDPCRSRHPRP